MSLPASPSFRLDGKRALVTGAGRGIGIAMAAALAQAGADVTLAARTQTEVEAAAGELRRAGCTAQALRLDVEDIAATKAAIAALPAFDILVNNAGTNRPASFLDVAIEDFDALMSLNVRAAFFVAQGVALRMRAEGRRGSIVNMSSQAGRMAAAGRPVYTVSKFAVEGMTRAMAVDLAPSGIRVNSICPTFVETEMTRPSLANAEFRDFVVSKIRLGRLGQVEDLMGAVVFLASDASALMTGSSLVVDGGWTA